MRQQSLSIVVPALNERRHLAATVDRLKKALAAASLTDYEVIIINDGSTDGTDEVARGLGGSDPCVRSFDNPGNLGLGASYTRGILQASKDYLVYIPADNSWPYESLLALFGSMAKADIVTSYASNPEVRGWGRRIISRLFTLALNFLFNRRMKYFNGLTIYPIEFLRTTRVNSTGFAFQAELMLKALFQDFSVIQLKLPIDEQTARSSKAVSVKNIQNVLATVIRLFFELQVLRRFQNGIASTPD
ncbi:MAG: glycosyltransferase family 2 protein [Deltaproteobacteria bacterium]|nr:glycosyltransferase family 2 protein [Deltaproteobacteria bacterium]